MARILSSILLCALPFFSWGESAVAITIQRLLMEIPLDSSLHEVEQIYRPTRSWSSSREPGDRVVRIQFQREWCRAFPRGVDRVRLGMLDDRVITVRAVFSAEQTRKEPLSALVNRISAQYGEPRRVAMTYGWQDANTALKVFDQELPLPDGSGVELRTAVELAELKAVPRYRLDPRSWNFDRIYKLTIGGM